MPKRKNNKVIRQLELVKLANINKLLQNHKLTINERKLIESEKEKTEKFLKDAKL